MSLPLAYKLRPTTLDGFVGQQHILGEGKILRRAIEKDKINSTIWFGPSGVGKTTLAHIISKMTKSEFIQINATESGAKELRSIISKADLRLYKEKRRTIVLFDEIHRAMTNVQDILLPQVERGVIILIGATTQNPMFAINGPLLSRSQLFEFKPLTTDDLDKVMSSVIEHFKTQNRKITFEEDVKEAIIKRSGGDARKLINVIEIIADTTDGDIIIKHSDVNEIMPRCHVVFGDDESFDSLSCIQGAIQASDVHGAIYWLAWAINHGQDLKVICRRLLVTAAEDVSICDPRVLPYVNAACQAAERVGFPEASIILSAAISYMAMTPRSKAAAKAIWSALAIDQEASKEIPNWLKDSHYKGAEKLGRGSYHDGMNQNVYEPIITGLFKAENGLEIKLMEANDEYWRKKLT